MIAAVFGVIFLANLVAFHSSRKIYRTFRQLGDAEKIEYRRSAASHFFGWASTFAFSIWIFGAISAFCLAIAVRALFFSMGPVPEDARDYKVEIPDEVHTLMKFTSDELPGVAVVNTALIEFEPKVVFAWHLRISIPYKKIVDNGMPSSEEQQLLYAFEDWIDPKIRLDGNALFLARVTHDGYRDLHYRVYEPETTNNILQEIINLKNYSRDFEFRIELDEEWEKADWYLSQGDSAPN